MQEGSGWRKGKKKIKIAGAKTERLGELAHYRKWTRSLTRMGTKTLRKSEQRERKSAPARWLPSPWGLERERRECLKREGGSIENFLHTEELVQSSERNSECE